MRSVTLLLPTVPGTTPALVTPTCPARVLAFTETFSPTGGYVMKAWPHGVPHPSPPQGLERSELRIATVHFFIRLGLEIWESLFL